MALRTGGPNADAGHPLTPLFVSPLQSCHHGGVRLSEPFAMALKPGDQRWSLNDFLLDDDTAAGNQSDDGAASTGIGGVAAEAGYAGGGEDSSRRDSRDSSRGSLVDGSRYSHDYHNRAAEKPNVRRLGRKRAVTFSKGQVKTGKAR